MNKFSNFFNNPHNRDKYSRLILSMNQKINLYKYKLDSFIKYKIFVCEGCNQKLRVPRRKGKVTVTCKKCGNVFKGRT